MTETKDLKSKFANATEVTSLTSTDRLMAIDAQGEPKKISASSFKNENTYALKNVTAGSTGWLRIAELSFDANGIVKISKNWGNSTPGYLIFSFLCHANGTKAGFLIVRYSPSGGAILSKFRLVVKYNSTCYLDVYAPITGNEIFHVNLIGGIATTLKLGNATDAEVPTGYSATEYSAFGGG